jgi:hypothetical protein
MRRPLVRSLRLGACLLAATVALGSLTACTESDPVGAPRPGIWTAAGEDTVRGNGSVIELRAMKQRWADTRDGRSYQFVASVSCFCPPRNTRPVIVSVRGSQVTSVLDAETREPRPVEGYWTIEALFDRAIAARAGGGRVRVTCSRSGGYPVWAEIGTPENDAGAFYGVSSVMLEE